MGFFKDSVQLISEMSHPDPNMIASNQRTLSSQTVGIEFDSLLKGMDRLSARQLKYVPEMVVVQTVPSGYMVEMDDLAKYMMGSNITSFSEALDNIRNANPGMNPELPLSIGVDEESILATLEAAKKESRRICPECGNPIAECTCGKGKVSESSEEEDIYYDDEEDYELTDGEVRETLESVADENGNIFVITDDANNVFTLDGEFMFNGEFVDEGAIPITFYQNMNEEASNYYIQQVMLEAIPVGALVNGAKTAGSFIARNAGKVKDVAQHAWQNKDKLKKFAKTGYKLGANGKTIARVAPSADYAAASKIGNALGRNAVSRNAINGFNNLKKGYQLGKNGAAVGTGAMRVGNVVARASNTVANSPVGKAVKYGGSAWGAYQTAQIGKAIDDKFNSGIEKGLNKWQDHKNQVAQQQQQQGETQTPPNTATQESYYIEFFEDEIPEEIVLEIARKLPEGANGVDDNALTQQAPITAKPFEGKRYLAGSDGHANYAAEVDCKGGMVDGANGVDDNALTQQAPITTTSLIKKSYLSGQDGKSSYSGSRNESFAIDDLENMKSVIEMCQSEGIDLILIEGFADNAKDKFNRAKLAASNAADTAKTKVGNAARTVKSKVTGDPGALRTKVTNVASTAASKVRNGARTAGYVAGNIKDKVGAKVGPVKDKIQGKISNVRAAAIMKKAELKRSPTDNLVGGGYDYSSYM